MKSPSKTSRKRHGVVRLGKVARYVLCVAASFSYLLFSVYTRLESRVHTEQSRAGASEQEAALPSSVRWARVGERGERAASAALWSPLGKRGSISLPCICERVLLGSAEREGCIAAIKDGASAVELIFAARTVPTITLAVLRTLPFLPPPRTLALGAEAGTGFDCSAFCACSSSDPKPAPRDAQTTMTTGCPFRENWRLVNVDGNETRAAVPAEEPRGGVITAWELPAGKQFAAATQFYLPHHALRLRRTPIWQVAQMGTAVQQLLRGLEARIDDIRAEYARLLAVHQIEPSPGSPHKWSPVRVPSRTLHACAMLVVVLGGVVWISRCHALLARLPLAS